MALAQAQKVQQILTDEANKFATRQNLANNAPATVAPIRSTPAPVYNPVVSPSQPTTPPPVRSTPMPQQQTGLLGTASSPTKSVWDQTTPTKAPEIKPVNVKPGDTYFAVAAPVQEGGAGAGGANNNAPTYGGYTGTRTPQGDAAARTTVDPVTKMAQSGDYAGLWSSFMQQNNNQYDRASIDNGLSWITNVAGPEAADGMRNYLASIALKEPATQAPRPAYTFGGLGASQQGDSIRPGLLSTTTSASQAGKDPITTYVQGPNPDPAVVWKEFQNNFGSTDPAQIKSGMAWIGQIGGPEKQAAMMGYLKSISKAGDPNSPYNLANKDDLSKYAYDNPHYQAGLTFAQSTLNKLGITNTQIKDATSLANAYQQRVSQAGGQLSPNELKHWKSAAYLFGIDDARLPPELKSSAFGMGTGAPDDPYTLAGQAFAASYGYPQIKDQGSLIKEYDARPKPLSAEEAQLWKEAAMMFGIDTSGFDLVNGNKTGQSAASQNTQNYNGQINIGSAANPVMVNPVDLYAQLGGGIYTGASQKDLETLNALINERPDLSGYLANVKTPADYQKLVDFANQNKAQAPLAQAGQAAYADKINAALIDRNMKGLQYDANIANVRPEDTSQYQLNKMLDQNGLLMQSAKGNAMQQANARGLLNSSIAVGAGQNAMIQGAQPFALQDASTYANERIQNQNALNTAAQSNQQSLLAIEQANQKAQMDAALANQKDQHDVNLANAGWITDVNKLNATNQFDANSQATQFGLDTAKADYLANNDYVNRANLAGTLNKLDTIKNFGQNIFNTASQTSANTEKMRQDYINALLTRAQNIGTNTDQQALNAQQGGITGTLNAQQAGLTGMLENQKSFNAQQQAILQGNITRENADQAFQLDVSKLKTEQDWKSYENALQRASDEKMMQWKLEAEALAGNASRDAASANASASLAGSKYNTDMQYAYNMANLQANQNADKTSLVQNLLSTWAQKEVSWEKQAETLNGIIPMLWPGSPANSGELLLGGKTSLSDVSLSATTNPSVKIADVPLTGMQFKEPEDFSKWMATNNLTNPDKIKQLSPTERKALEATLMNAASTKGVIEGNNVTDPSDNFEWIEGLGLGGDFASKIENATRNTMKLAEIDP